VPAKNFINIPPPEKARHAKSGETYPSAARAARQHDGELGRRLERFARRAPIASRYYLTINNLPDRLVCSNGKTMSAAMPKALVRWNAG
jgi:hypothetical protein